jgi:hypothetical protein
VVLNRLFALSPAGAGGNAVWSVARITIGLTDQFKKGFRHVEQ